MLQDSLLKTKLHIPSVRSQLVSRPRLVELLDRGLDRKLTLISAPAGFGKTTLLSECAARCGYSVAWISLDKGDNEPARFWTYVVAALHTVPNIKGTELGQAMFASFRPSGPPRMETLIGNLINHLIEITEPFALILDDLHEITDPQINDALALLLENQPQQMHLVISSRSDPPWPLARWRASGQVTELRTDDLRFTPAETAAFLNDVMGLDLSATDIAALDARAEGWIAGLQLAALALQGTYSRQGRDASSFLRAFSGSHRFILDYLVEEVLDRQPVEIQDFLLQTSILERLIAPLCDAVRFGSAESPSGSEGGAGSRGAAVHVGSALTDPGRSDSQAILEQLERANLFLVPLDDQRRWYRYHHLFADLLRFRLEQERHEQMVTLHRRASAWCERQGLLSEAVGHALAAGDVEGVARMARQNALATLDRGELMAFVGLIAALPDNVVSARPWLSIAHAWALVFAGQLDAVEPRLESVETAVDALNNAECAPGTALSITEGPVLSTAEGRHIAGHMAAIRAYVAALRGDMSCAAELTRDALERLPEEDLAVRGLGSALLGSVLRWSGDLAAAAQSLARALSITRAAADISTTVEALCSLAAVQLAQGRLHETVVTCREVLPLADEQVRRGGQRSPFTASRYNIMSQVLYEWNDLDGALLRAGEGIELSEQWGWPEGLALGYRRRARALQALGDPEGAHRAIQKARQAASGLSPWFGAHMAAHQARLWLAQGDLASAAHWAQQSGLSAGDEFSYQRLDEFSTLARVLIAQGRWDKASMLLPRLLEVAEAAGAMGYLIEVLSLQALSLQAQGQDDEALTALEPALALAEPEGYVRTFIDEGAAMGRLLKRAIAQAMAVDYAGKLLVELENEGQRSAVPATIPRGAVMSTLVEPLSPRETEVLRLLSTHLSHAEMAEVLVISVNTVRSHVKSIYSKLDAHSRMEAVQRARELGLLT